MEGIIIATSSTLEADSFAFPFAEEGAGKHLQAVAAHLHAKGRGVHAVEGAFPKEAEAVLVASSGAGPIADGTTENPFWLAIREGAARRSERSTASSQGNSMVCCLEINREDPTTSAEKEG